MTAGSQLGHVGSLIAARGIYFPDQGLNPGLLSWELGISATGLPGESLVDLFQGLMSPFLLHTVCVGFGGVFVSDASLSLMDALQPLLAT